MASDTEAPTPKSVIEVATTVSPEASTPKSVVKVATTVSLEARIAAAQAVLSEGAVEVTEVLRDRRDETLALVERLLASADIKGTFSLPGREDANDVNVELAEAGIDARLMSLVVEPINALSEAQRTVQGRVRSGEEIARAIPDVTAFLAEVNLQQEDGVVLDFFELNVTGQLVMKDDCPEAYGLGENALQARMRQTRIVYRDEDGQTQVMTGEECFKVTKRDKENIPLEMEVSEAAQKITPKSILMARGLPTLKWDGERHTGEYARMNTGQLERSKITWTDDASLDASRARNADWAGDYGDVRSAVAGSDGRGGSLGSRGVLRVNLNLAS